MLTATDLRFSYHNRPVLSGASLTLAPGELVCLLGVNGAGKSTLLRTLLGLQKPDFGEVTLNGAALMSLSIQHRARLLAYVPQSHIAPFPYTVYQVALMGRLPINGFFKSPTAADIECVNRVLEQLGILHLANHVYTKISGGERQLTLIARALAQGAQLLIMDEPLAGLDYGNQVRLLERLSLLSTQGYGVLMSTHDPNQLATGCQRVVVLIDGRIVAEGAPVNVLTPKMMHQLYGVHVDLLRTADGRHMAFQPAKPNARGVTDFGLKSRSVEQV